MIDDNREYNSLAVDTNGAIKNLLVDPITGRLLIEASIDSETPILNSSKIDANYESVAQAVDDNGVIRPLLMANNKLLIDLLIE